MAMSERPLGVGLIGAGQIGRFRAKALAATLQARLVAVTDLDPVATSKAAADFGARHYASLESLLTDAEVEAIIVSTPPATHQPLGLAAIQAGKHLLVEKPLAHSIEACERLVSAADVKDVRLATGYTLRQSPAAKLARRIIDSGGIGQIDHVRAFHGHAGGKDFGPPWITNHAATGGGTLMDNGIHMIDLALWFLGDAKSSCGFATNYVWKKSGQEDSGVVVFQSAAGKVGLVESSWTEWKGYGYRCEVYGDNGSVRFGFPPLWLFHTSGSPGTNMRTQREFFWRYQIQERIKGWQWSLVESLRLDIEDWVDAIRRGVEPPASGRDGLAGVRVAKSVNYQAVSGLPETAPNRA